MWNSGFVRQCQDWELHNFGELLRKLQVLGECSEDEDKLIWKVIKSGNFSVKSFYSFLESDGRVSFPSKVVWGFWTPVKVVFFFFLGGCLGKVPNLRSNLREEIGC